MQRKKKEIFLDLFYCIGAVALMNVVLQFIVYPAVNYKIGAAEFGNMLFWLGVVSILAPSFGMAVNNTRLVFPERKKTLNGDYNITLLQFAVISFVMLIIICLIQKSNIWEYAIFVYIAVFSILRNYSTVEYRLSLSYKKQFCFYSILSAGYIVGGVLCFLTGTWALVFIIGETAAVIYVVLRGEIYNAPLKCTEYQKQITNRCWILAGAYLLTNLMLNLDRIVLKYGVSNEAVSQYYVLSLLGKTLAIIGGPISSIIISYISKENYKMNKKEFGKIVICIVGVSLFFIVAAVLITPIFIRILYPGLYHGIDSLNLIVNAAQVFYFSTTLLLVVVLTICDAKWQLRIQISYAAIFIILSIVGTNYAGLAGFALAALISNVSYFVLAVSVGFRYARKIITK